MMHSKMMCSHRRGHLSFTPFPMLLALALLLPLAAAAAQPEPAPAGARAAMSSASCPASTAPMTDRGRETTLPLEVVLGAAPEPETRSSCYWRDDVSCGGCSYFTSCLQFGWSNRFGQECTGRRIEYCHGVPTGIWYPVFELRCGCTP